jgi:phosphatidylinositol 4-kinase
VADPAQALSFFSQLFKPNPYTAQYAVKCLRSFNADQILFYIPQLVQALRYDTIGYVFEYLIWSSNQSPLLCHQLMWNMMTNRFRDEEGTVKDPDIGFKIDALLDAIKDGFDVRAAEFYKREFKFAGDLTEISNRIKPFDKDNGDRKRECKKEIQKFDLEELVYLPSNPGCVVTGINRNVGIPLQSAAKAPYLAEFEVKELGVQNLEKACTENNPETLQTLLATEAKIQKTIFKAGDDCRQDMLALQVIQIFRLAFRSVGLEVYVMPYKVVATSPGYGIN